MKDYIEDNQNELVAFPELSEIIQLEPEQIEQAWQITEQVKAEKNKLQIYFQALALVAFEEWLNKREPNLSINTKQNSLFNRESAQAINAVCNLQVGDFKVCLIPTVGFSDELIVIPETVVRVHEFLADFYVVIGVEDELEIAAIRGFNRYEDLVNMIAKIPVLSDTSYKVNLVQFHQQTDELLLELQCSSTTDITLPEASVDQTNHLKDLMQILTQKTVNAGLWMQNQLDEFAQELSWQLLPAPSPLRKYQVTPAEDLDNILTEIDGVEIPSVAARSYRNLELGEAKLRLYAITWYLPKAEGDWSLLLILGVIPGNKFPVEAKLRISNLTEVLDEPVLSADSDTDNVYIQIAGSKQEKFLVTVTSADGNEASVLFEFRPELL
ncbi:hypothetical protein NIES267_40730 [Calothrix parasitica NIES-267]|uniref:DUF1822 family protein n=1 Tax=Calothrix parasitica NIES-267 TaxID=1973488 RepID=A0A1Z4LTK5_9CYAN|nr:hypothetical protein NIES267_40730 [Calothrix parasitica NIES-267]